MWNQFDIGKAFIYVCEEREILSKLMSAIFRDYFYVEESIFANTITAKKPCVPTVSDDHFPLIPLTNPSMK